MTDFLSTYNDELRFLRERGIEFSHAYPNVAKNLGMHQDGAADPFVERLMEATAFLTARVHQRIEQEQSSLIVQLMNRICPLWYSFTPSICSLRVLPDFTSPEAYNGFVLPRGTEINWRVEADQAVPVKFVTARDVKLQPLSMTAANYKRIEERIPSSFLSSNGAVKQFLTLEFQTHSNLSVSKLELDYLELTCISERVKANAIFRTLHGECSQVLVWCEETNQVTALGPECIEMPSLDSSCGTLLPDTPVGIGGLRLIREYFAAPSAFLSLQINGLGQFIKASGKNKKFNITLVIESKDESLIDRIGPDDFDLFTVPAINLFNRRCDPINVDHSKPHQYMVVDKLKPREYKVHNLQSVSGRKDNGEFVSILPLHAQHQIGVDSSGYSYSVHREERISGDISGKRATKRLDAVGDVGISISAPTRDLALTDLKSLHIKAQVSNSTVDQRRELNYSLRADYAAPVYGFELVRWPSVPLGLPRLEQAWLALQVAHAGFVSGSGALKSNYAEEVRNWLDACSADSVQRNSQINSIVRVETSNRHRKVAGVGPLTWGREVVVDMEIDPSLHPDNGAYLFSAVLHKGLCELKDLNTDLSSVFRFNRFGEYARWASWEKL